MSKRSEEKYLADMLQYAREARDLAANADLERFTHDRLLQLALAYLLQIIGEAAGHVSGTTRAELPTLPWQQMAGMRHRLVHDYTNISFNIVWDVTRSELPALIAALEKIIPPEPPSA